MFVSGVSSMGLVGPAAALAARLEDQSTVGRENKPERLQRPATNLSIMGRPG
jgi:hypothetical protein